VQRQGGRLSRCSDKEADSAGAATRRPTQQVQRRGGRLSRCNGAGGAGKEGGELGLKRLRVNGSE
jgi:hypothetical protein